MSLEYPGPGAMPVWTEPWWVGPQLRMVVGGRGEQAERDEGALSPPAEVADCFARQADELAALVESALRKEDDDHRALVELLRVRHQRRVTSLRVLAESLGEAHAQLDELSHQLRTTTPATPEGAAVTVPNSQPDSDLSVPDMSVLIRGGL